jgi:xanthine dehydrogenase YagS FAD-binding subunit
MQRFTYAAPHSIAEAIEAFAQAPARSPRFLAGGTTLVDLMKLNVEVPDHVIDITGVGELAYYDVSGPRELVFGSLALMSDVADDPVVRSQNTALSE